MSRIWGSVHGQNDAPDWVDQQEVEATMHAYLKNLQEVHDAAIITRYRQELATLIESKHLLIIPSAEKLLAELTSIVN